MYPVPDHHSLFTAKQALAWLANRRISCEQRTANNEKQIQNDMKFIIPTIFLFIFSTSILPAQSYRPNVILILTDDQGTLDLNSYGAEDLYTPHLDRLAAEGIRFTQFYVGAAVCSPSRASLLTGKNPHAAGLPGNASSQEGQGGMPAEQVTIAEMLQSAGYATGHVGKWHLGYTPETMPNGQGFDYSFGHMGGCIDNYSHFFYWNGPNRHDLWENGEEIHADGQFFPDLMVEKGRQFIIDHREEPFFLYFAINTPHYPLQPTARWRKHYEDLPMPRRDYAGFVSTTDERIGGLLATLDEYGLDENTIVIFQSDHGHSCETRTFGGGGYAGPFRGAKFSLFEGGIRVPAIVRWPAQLSVGEVVDEPVMSMDWLPTLADFCGVEALPEGVEGKSLGAVLQEESATPHKAFFWKMGRQWAVRQGPWKLIGNPRDPAEKFPLDPEKDALFLVNLEQDLSELENLTGRYPEKVEELKKIYLDWPYASPADIPVMLPPLDNKAYGADVTLSTDPHPKYRADGPATLVDNKRGTFNFTDGRWLGFLDEEVTIEIDMGKVMQADTVALRCLQDLPNYILFPEKVEFTFSKDGQTFSSWQEVRVPEAVRKEEYGMEVFALPADQSFRYLRVRADNVGRTPEWFPRTEGDVWLFVDEVVVE